MQLVGGLIKALPVGQPVLGGVVGNLFTVASEFDWNKKDPFKEGADTFKKAGASVTEFMENNKELLTKIDDSPVRAGKADKLHISRQLKDAQSALRTDTNTIRTKLAGLDLEQRPALLSQMADLEGKIAAAEARLKPLAAQMQQIPGSHVDVMRGIIARTKSMKPRKALDEYRAALGKLQAERGTMYQKILALKGFKEDDLTSAANVSDQAMGDLLAHSASVEELEKKQDQAKLQVQDLKLKQSEAQETRNTLVDSLSGVGEGVGQMGAALVRLAAPFNTNDPAVQDLMKRMLESEDSELHKTYAELQKQLLVLAEEKKRAAEKLLQWHQKATATTGQLSGTLTALTKVSQQRQSLSGALDAGTRTFLRAMQQRARESLGRSIYDFVQAYQYEFLEDVSDDFFTFDTWVERLRKLETDRQNQAEAAVAAARKKRSSTRTRSPARAGSRAATHSPHQEGFRGHRGGCPAGSTAADFRETAREQEYPAGSHAGATITTASSARACSTS